MCRIRRMTRSLPVRLLLLVMALSAAPAVIMARAVEADPGPISEDAASALARMTRTLSASQFAVRIHTIRTYAGPNGEVLHIAHDSKTMFRRPDRFAIETTGDDGSSKLLYDGNTAVVFAIEQGRYARFPAAGNIDTVLTSIAERTGADFPVAELLSENPSDTVLSGIVRGSQVDVATIDGVRCRHFFFSQVPDAELELWTEDNERSLPRRLIVTYLTLPGRPILIAEISDWDFAIQASESAFAFDPPAGAIKVELASQARGVRGPGQLGIPR